MGSVNQMLLAFHFVGLALGFSVGFANLVMSRLIARATPAERATLERFPPAMGRVGRVGLGLLWATGLTLVYTKWGGFAALPWQFYAKLAAVVLLTGTTEFIHRWMRLGQNGDTAAAARVEPAGKIAMALALTAVAFAVLTFD